MKKFLSIGLLFLLFSCRDEVDRTQRNITGSWRIERIDFIAPNLQPPDSVMYYGTSNIEFKKCKTGHRCEVIYNLDKSPTATATYVIDTKGEIFFNQPCCDANLYRSLGMAFSSRYEVDFDKSSRRSFLYGLMQFPSKEGFKIPTQKVKVYLVKN